MNAPHKQQCADCKIHFAIYTFPFALCLFAFAIGTIGYLSNLRALLDSGSDANAFRIAACLS